MHAVSSESSGVNKGIEEAGRNDRPSRRDVTRPLLAVGPSDTNEALRTEYLGIWRKSFSAGESAT
jgi:hypothetical protein